MKRYRNLEIMGTRDEIDAFIIKLKETKSPFSYMAKLSNEYAENIYVPKGSAFCLKTNRKSLLESKIWLVRRNNTLKVTNITAEESLSRSDYNTILYSFVTEEVEKLRFGYIKILLSGEEESLEDILNATTYESLIKWIKLSNQDNPINHEFDFERWVKFVCNVYKYDPYLSMTDFKTGLEELIPRLSNSNIKELTDKLEYSLNFLRVYHENR